AVAIGAGVSGAAPALQHDVFIGGAARVAGLLSGAAAVRLDEGWALSISGQPVVVTAACGARDFYLMTTALLGWHLAQRGGRAGGWSLAVAGAVLAAVPLVLFINALRVVVVAQAHRWVIPRMPEAYESFLHMLAGAAVF